MNELGKRVKFDLLTGGESDGSYYNLLYASVEIFPPMFETYFLRHKLFLLNKFLLFFADEHEVDVIGYGGASDDDHSSIRSGTSDGGVTVTTWRQLSIAGEA